MSDKLIQYKTVNNIIESKYNKFIINFSLAILIATTFISFFFFIYTKDTERYNVINNVNYTIKDLSNSFSQLIPIYQEKIPNQIYTIIIDDMKTENDKIIKDNSNLIYGCIKLYGAILIISFILAYIISKYNNNINFQDILITNIIVLISLVATEYLITYSK